MKMHTVEELGLPGFEGGAEGRKARRRSGRDRRAIGIILADGPAFGMRLNADGVRRLWERREVLRRAIREKTATTSVEVKARSVSEDERI